MSNTTFNNTVTKSVGKMKIGRRGFLASALGGLTVAFVAPDAGRMFGLKAATTTPQQLANAYVKVGTDGSIVLMFGGAEMGQGIKTGLSQILAEELMVDWNQVTVQQSLPDAIVSYMTGGSMAVASKYNDLRTAGAAARESLIAAAMLLKGDTNRANYTAASATVKHSSGTTWLYKDLATSAGSPAAQALVPATLPLTNPSAFRLIGKPLQRVDIPAKVDGSAKFGIDTWIPGMVFAAIKHCPVFGGTLASTPTKPSSAIAVVPCKASDNRGLVIAGTYNAVAVVASDTWTAKNLANSLSVKWNLPASTSSVDSTQLGALAQSLATGTGGALVAEPAGASEATVLSAVGTQPTVDAVYTVPYLAHATMEVLSCTVRLTYNTGGIITLCEMWAPTQAASWALGTAQTLINAAQPTAPLGPANIIVNTTYLGGGLGRKIELDFISQAVQVAIAVKKPVKLTWMREEDMAHDNYRPMAATAVKATLDGSNNIAAWYYRTVSSSITDQRGWLYPPGSVDGQAVEGASAIPYARGNYIVEWVPLPAGVPLGWWRSVGSSINTLAVECTIDELAQKAGNMDPFAFRYRLVSDSRVLTVLQTADSNTQWRKSLASGHFWGMAISQWLGTIVCEVVEISQPTLGSIKVHRVDCFVDCGTVINPNQVEAQMQGGIVHGLNAALYGQITFTAGKANQTNFRNYRMIRVSEMPQITVKIIPSNNPPSGTGEPGVPPIGAAIANAYSRLTGSRVRNFPLFPGATMGGL